MKKQILWIPLVLTVIFASAAVSTRAQSAYSVRANVPFDFVVGNKTIPAGRITAHGVSGAMQGSLLGARESDQGKLVFHKYGNRYFLAQICIPGLQAWEVMKSKEERSLERDTRLVKNSKPEQVIVAATID